MLPINPNSELQRLLEDGRHVEAICSLHEITKSKNPENATLIAILASEYMALGDLKNAIKYINYAYFLTPSNEVIALNRALWTASSASDPKLPKQIIEDWSRRFLDPLVGPTKETFNRTIPKGERLRVGYVSGDFNNHPSRFFIEPIFRHHDKAKFEIHAFMTGTPDVFTDGLKPLVEHWHDIANLTDRSLYSLIKAVGIDVLVDLSGHTKGQRLGVFAMRAAPVQITWFGYMQTLGMEAMDWRITDAEISPPDADQYYTEKLLRISSHYAFQPPVNMSEPPPLPARRNGFVTMICLNDNRKISDTSITLWSKILSRNANVGLILISAERNEQFADQSLRPRLRKFNLPDDRVSVVPRLNFQSYLNLSSIADFAVDTTPVSGGTTTLLGASIGLPTLCLRAPKCGPLSALSSALMQHMDLNECITTTDAQFVNKAQLWLNDWALIEQLRSRCLSGLKQSPLLRHQTITREIEQGFIQCHEKSF